MAQTSTPRRRQSRASRGTNASAQAPQSKTAEELNAENAAARQQAAADINAAGATGTPATGDNGGGRTEPESRPDAAADPVKLPTKSESKKSDGPTPTAQKRMVATWMAKIAADALDGWVPEEHDGVTREFAANVIASGLNYLPIPLDGWDDRLPERSGAGGRGAKVRKGAVAAA